MATAFICPHCSTSLKTGTELPPEKAVQCPKCRNVFRAKEGIVPEEETEFPTIGLQKEDPRRSDDWWKSSDSGQEEDSPRSRTKSRTGEDDRKSNSSRTPRKRPLDESIDWREDSRREDSRPCRRRKQAKTNPMLPLLLGLFGLLIIGGLVAGFIWLGGGGPKKLVPADQNLIALIPSNTRVVIGWDVPELERLDFWQGFDGLFDGPELEPLQLVMDKAGIEEEDFHKVLLTTSANQILQIQTQHTIIATLQKKSFNPTDFKTVGGLHEMARNGKTYYRDPKGGYYYLPDNKTLVVSSDEKNIHELIDKPAGQITVAKPIQEFAEKGGGVPYWLATTDAMLVKEMMAIGQAGFGQLGGQGANHPLQGLIQTSKGVGMFYQPNREKIHIIMSIMNQDTQAVSNLADQRNREMRQARRNLDRSRNELRQMVPDADAFQVIVDVLESAEYSYSGEILDMSMAMSTAPFERMTDRIADQIANDAFNKLPAGNRNPFGGMFGNPFAR